MDLSKFKNWSGYSNSFVVCWGTTKELLLCQCYKNYGNIRPNEDKVITDEEKKLVSLIAKHHETLSSSLKNDDLIVF